MIVVRFAGTVGGAGVGLIVGGFGTALLYESLADSSDPWRSLGYGLVGAAIGLPAGAALGNGIAAGVELRGTRTSRLVLAGVLGALVSLEVAAISGLAFIEHRWSWPRALVVAAVGAGVASLIRARVPEQLRAPSGAGPVARAVMEGIGLGLGLIGGAFVSGSIEASAENGTVALAAIGLAALAGFILGSRLADAAKPRAVEGPGA